jgi:ADP-ribose pyrophosphatase
VSTFRRLGEREVWRGTVVSAGVGRYAAPDGTEFERDVVHHPGAVSVVPALDAGAAVLLVRQFRSAVGRELLEIPAGKRDIDGEAPEITAGRELEEEVGMRAGRLEKLAEFYNSPGFCDEHSHVYLALDLEPCEASAQGVEETHMTIERVALDDVPALIASGAIVDAKTIIGLCLARERLRSSPVG